MPKHGAPLSRQQQAFESLLDQECEACPTAGSGNKGHGRGQPRRKQVTHSIVDKRHSEALPGFALRESKPSDFSTPSPAQEQLYSMFGSILDKQIIDAAVHECNNSVEPAVEMLLALCQDSHASSFSQSQPATREGVDAMHAQSQPIKIAWMLHVHQRHW